MKTIVADLTHGARVLWKHPGVYAAALITLAVGLAAATTMFSIVNAVLLEPLPYADADRLALVWDRTGDTSRDVWLSPLSSRICASAAVPSQIWQRSRIGVIRSPEQLSPRSCKGSPYPRICSRWWARVR